VDVDSPSRVGENPAWMRADALLDS